MCWALLDFYFAGLGLVLFIVHYHNLRGQVKDRWTLELIKGLITVYSLSHLSMYLCFCFPIYYHHWKVGCSIFRWQVNQWIFWEYWRKEFSDEAVNKLIIKASHPSCWIWFWAQILLSVCALQVSSSLLLWWCFIGFLSHWMSFFPLKNFNHIILRIELFLVG